MQLTIWERLLLEDRAGRLNGRAALMHKALKIIDAVMLSEEEKRKANLQSTPVGGLTWDDDKIEDKEIEVKDREVIGLLKRLMRDEIEKHEVREDWNPSLMKRLMELTRKIDLDFDRTLTEVCAKLEEEEEERERIRQMEEKERECEGGQEEEDD